MSLFSTLTYLLVLITTTQNLPLVHSKHKHKNNGPIVHVTKQLSFPKFNQDIKLLGSAKLSQSHSLQIPDQSQALDLKHQAGRALYSSPIRLFDPPTETPASFQTTFSFQFHNISTKNQSSNTTTSTTTSTSTSSSTSSGGSGLTFIIVPDEFTVGRPGPWLGMINDACDEDYKAVAVEFDTRFNPEFGDPSDNHVGINLGTMVSTKAINASQVGVNLNDGSVHRAWISYDGRTRIIDIRLGSDTGNFPSKPVFSGPLDISPFLNEYMFVGFSASTGTAPQIHSVMSWNFTSECQAFLRVPSEETCESRIAVGDSSKMAKTEAPISFFIFIAVAILVLTVAVLLSLYYNARKRSKNKPIDIGENSISVLAEAKSQKKPVPPNKPRKFTFSELSYATAGFNEAEILGSDSRGVYYRGKLSNGCHVAVKRFAPGFLSSAGTDRTRLPREVSLVSKARHPNLVPIRGWCQERRNEFLVVYDFFPNGGLEKWLFGVGVLPWTRRYKVVRDVAEGLAFLHSKDLAHKNLKTSSVFLDASFRAVLGDFGFVLCGAESRRFESMVSRSSDVFEFGVFVLEVVAGKTRSEETSLLEFGWRLHESNEKVKLVDKRMGKVLRVDQVLRVLDIALLCTLNDSKGRPNMEEVVELLSSERPIPELPPSRPVSLFPYSSMSAGLCTGYSCASFK